MDRGQQPLPPGKRQTLIHNILEQQREQVQNIQNVHFEVMLLNWLANQQSFTEEQNSENDDNKDEMMDVEKKAELEEEMALAKELNDILSLTPEQKEKIKKVRFLRTFH